MMVDHEQGPDDFSPSYVWAYAYRRIDLSVIPAVQNEKRPLAQWREFQENGIPPATFDRWYGERGEHRLNPRMGFITGRACLDADSALFVIDLDVKDGANGLATWRGLLAVHNNDTDIETWTAVTGSGGRHIYFRCPDDRCPGTKKEVSKGIDVRGVGGFIMAPPSPHHAPGTRYEWAEGRSPWDIEIADAPEWLIEWAQTIAGKGTQEHAAEEIKREQDAFGLGTGKAEDGRETLMYRMVYAAFLHLARKAIRIPTVEELIQDVWPAWQQSAKVDVQGKTTRGFAQVREKCVYILDRFNRGHLEFKTLDDIMDGADKEGDTPGGDDWSAGFGTGAQAQAPKGITATAFVLPSEQDIPRREWLYGRHLIRGFTAATVAPGGVGKSQQAIADALAMATGRTLVRNEPVKRLRAWYWNGEDPIDEITRRIAATAKHYGITRDDLAGYFFADSGRDMEIKIAVQDKSGTHIAAPVVDAMIRTIAENKIDVVIIDPFVSSHNVTENDNMAIDAVVKTWGRIANVTGCAVELIHHVRKTNGDEVTVEDGRGAVALLAAVRSARALNQMGQDTADKLGVDNRRRFFSVTVGKANLYVPDDASVWHELVNVDLNNGSMGLPGDSVGVVTAWDAPDPLANVTGRDVDACRAALLRAPDMNRRYKQSDKWFGYLVCETLGWDPENKADCHKVERVLATWIASGAFSVADEPQRNGRSVKVVKLGVQS